MDGRPKDAADTEKMNFISNFAKMFVRHRRADGEGEQTMKYLIACLGNVGAEYDGTRHNIGFHIGDAVAASIGAEWKDGRYGFVAKGRVKNAEVVLLKPSTFMNLSGNAVRYWMQQEHITEERLLVVCDDLSLPVGKIRIRPAGSEGGHNGLKHISSVLGNQQFARLRMGIGNDFPRGGQVDWVLGRFADEDRAHIDERTPDAVEAVKAFCLSGITFAMNHFNKK